MFLLFKCNVRTFKQINVFTLEMMSIIYCHFTCAHSNCLWLVYQWYLVEKKFFRLTKNASLTPEMLAKMSEISYQWRVKYASFKFMRIFFEYFTSK